MRKFAVFLFVSLSASILEAVDRFELPSTWTTKVAETEGERQAIFNSPMAGSSDLMADFQTYATAGFINQSSAWAPAFCVATNASPLQSVNTSHVVGLANGWNVLHIPDSCTPPTGGDGLMTVINTDDPDWIWSFYGAERIVGSSVTFNAATVHKRARTRAAAEGNTSPYHARGMGVEPFYIGGSGAEGACPASAIYSFASVRKEDLDAGEITSAIGWLGKETCWPHEKLYPCASESSVGANDSNALPAFPDPARQYAFKAGERLLLDPSIDIDALVGISSHVATILKGLQTYGAITVDSSGNFGESGAHEFSIFVENDAQEADGYDYTAWGEPGGTFADNDEFLDWLFDNTRWVSCVESYPGECDGDDPPPDLTNHPFLVVSQENYAALVSSSTTSPWSDIKAEAVSFLAGPLGTYSGASTPQDNCNQMAQLMGANALLYVLAVGESSASSVTYRNNIIGMLDDFEDLWDSEIPNFGTYEGNVPMNAAFFNSVIALDVIYPDLTSGQRSTYETMFSSYIAYNRTQPSSWEMANYGANAIWSIFLGTSPAQISLDVQTYRDGFFAPGDGESWLREEGSFGGGSEYGWARIGGSSLEKIAKWGFKYVAEYTGVDSYYDNESLKNYFEWQYSGQINPFVWHTVFGDTNNDYSLGYNYWYNAAISSHTLTSSDLTVGNWSSRAAGWASRLASIAGPVKYPDSLIVYANATAVVASTPSVSVVFPRQGAAFWDSVDQSTGALQGVLWNAKTRRYDHIHKEQNSLYLAGYGEVLMSHSGYFFGSSVLGFPLSWNNDNARSANVCLIGNQDHVTMLDPDLLHARSGGDGITEYLNAPTFDYASGHSTTSYGTMGSHTRNFVFVHPADGAGGYWVSLDELHTSTYPSVNALWHPYGNTVTTTTASREWAWPVASHNTSTTTLNVYLGTPPTSISFSSSAFQGKHGINEPGTYLNALYNVDASSNARIITVLYPSNTSHSKASFVEMTPSGINTETGVLLISGVVSDYLTISSQSVTSTFGGGTVTGKASFVRLVNSVLKSFFVRQGTEFDSDEATRKGFSSPVPVSMYMRDTSGVITSTGTSITFYYPDIESVYFDGVEASGTQGSDSFTTIVSSGNHTFSLITVEDPEPIAAVKGGVRTRGGVRVR